MMVVVVESLPMKTLKHESEGTTLHAVERGQGDCVALLHALAVEKAVVIGVSSGSGIAAHFALAYSAALAGVAFVQPVYAGAQPFATPADLEAIAVPTLVVRGSDPMHPRAVSDSYLGALRNARALDPDDVALHAKLAEFCSACFASDPRG
jgi:pimeloyl-ACP methyl ester carboxylesterase